MSTPLKLERDLNAEQRAAVTHTEGPLLVLAGAGSGKTRVVTRRIAYILKRRLAAPQEILAVTFTNKAANEMRERVVELVGKKAAAGITLSTFHSFCLGVLRQHIERIGYRKNFSVSSDADSRTLIRRVLNDMDGVEESFSPSIFRERIGLIKGGGARTEPPAEGKAAETEAKYERWTELVYEAYQSALRAANALDFDDLLTFVLRLWDEDPGVLSEYQARYKYFLVDEYQDTNRVQYELLRRLVDARKNICVVGDDDQSIYGWRGADVRNILNFAKTFPGARTVHLGMNYRSTATILQAANAVIANNRGRHAKEMRSFGDKGRELDWIVTGDEEHEAKMIVEWMQYIQSKTGASPGDFAVLYRSNLQSRSIEVALRHAGVPYAVYGGQDFYERAEVRDIVAYLKLLANPWDEASFLRAVNMPRRGIGDVALHTIHEICRVERLSFGKAMAQALKTGRVAGPAARGMREFLALMDEYRRRLRGGGETLAALVRDLVDRVRYRDELERTSKSLEIASLKWENVDAVVRSIAQFETTAQNPTLAGFLDESALCKDGDRADTRDGPSAAVSLMTVHSAKGLEFPFVFIAGVEEGQFPHAKSRTEPEIEEERRLFYVALTRARRHVTLFEAVSRTIRGREQMTTPSRFLKEIPETIVRKKIYAAREMVAARVAPGVTEPSVKRRKAP